MSVSIKDIVKETGLSVGTVSNYLNGKVIKEKNRQLIEEAIKKLNYKINAFGRSLKTNKSNTIGIILPFFDDPFASRLISEIEKVLRHFSYAVIICDTMTNTDIEKEVLEFLTERKVDGLIIFPTSETGAIYTEYLENKLPIVFLDKILPDLNADSIVLDNAQMSALATEYLIGKGHTKIGVLCGPEGTYSADMRLKGFLETMEKHAIPVPASLVKRGNYTHETMATELSIEMMRSHDNLTAILASNFYFTMGAVIACNTTGRQIGKDISIFGFDNFNLTKIVKPKLTFVEQPLEEMADLAARLVVARINNCCTEAPKPYLMRGKIVEGNSIVDLRK